MKLTYLKITIISFQYNHWLDPVSFANVWELLDAIC